MVFAGADLFPRLFPTRLPLNWVVSAGIALPHDWECERGDHSQSRHAFFSDRLFWKRQKTLTLLKNRHARKGKTETQISR